MTEILPIIFSVALIIITAVFVAVGLQLVLVLRELKRTLTTVNSTVAEAEQKINNMTDSLQNLGGIATGLKTGVKVFETFVGWLNKKKEEKKQEIAEA